MRPARPRYYSGDADLSAEARKSEGGREWECRRTRRLTKNTGGGALACPPMPSEGGLFDKLHRVQSGKQITHDIHARINARAPGILQALCADA